MSEFITLQVGQCGNQIGSQFWPLILQEYGINDVPGGIFRENNVSVTKNNATESLHSFFSGCEEFDVTTLTKFADTKNNKLKARAILIDMEDSVVDRFHTGPLKHLFDKKCTVENYPGSGNNWAQGYFTHGVAYHDIIEDTIRKSVEECNNLHGFLIIHSVGGGTGSGLGSYILELLEDQFAGIERFVTCIYPNGTEDVITCPYNMALTTKCLINSATCVFPVENRSLLEIVNLQQKQKQSQDTLNYVDKCTPFQDMNSIVVNMLLNLTCGSRFPGSMNVDMSDMSTNLIPYPKLHFISTGLSPITVSIEKHKSHIQSSKIKGDIFVDSCYKKNQLLQLDPLGLNSVILGTCLIGRGGFTVADMRNYVEKLQSRGHFTEWSSKLIRTGLCEVPPAGHNTSMLSMFNTSAMHELFSEVLNQFNRLYHKKAHLHHYTKIDDFEKSYFDECQENILDTILNYKSVMNVTKIQRPRFKVV